MTRRSTILAFFSLSPRHQRTIKARYHRPKHHHGQPRWPKPPKPPYSGVPERALVADTHNSNKGKPQPQTNSDPLPWMMATSWHVLDSILEHGEDMEPRCAGRRWARPKKRCSVGPPQLLQKPMRATALIQFLLFSTAPQSDLLVSRYQIIL